MSEEKPKEYKIMLNATNGYHLIADDAIHLNKEHQKNIFIVVVFIIFSN